VSVKFQKELDGDGEIWKERKEIEEGTGCGKRTAGVITGAHCSPNPQTLLYIFISWYLFLIFWCRALHYLIQNRS